ncbi:MAG: glycosyltransferase family 2 protein [Acidobacteria bacterium]|nr:glycosyltransferase family 2 protein [Acidobacteriota bacterium]
MISVLIPVYNSGARAAEASARILQALGRPPRLEILFGDDGSSDDSAAVLMRLFHQDDRLRVFRHLHRGLGYTLRRLIGEARGEVCVYLDIDLSFDVTHLPHLIEESAQYDVVVASKYCGGVPSVLPFARRVASRLYYRLVKQLCGVNVRDIGSGMVVFRREPVWRLQLSSDGFNFHAEFFHKVRMKQLSVLEVAVPYFHAPDGSFKPLKHGTAAVAELLVYRLTPSRWC